MIGGGAAGLTAAWFAADAGCQDVLVLERGDQPGAKVLISGGQRCNVLPEGKRVPDDVQQPYHRPCAEVSA